MRAVRSAISSRESRKAHGATSTAAPANVAAITPSQIHPAPALYGIVVSSRATTTRKTPVPMRAKIDARGSWCGPAASTS